MADRLVFLLAAALLAGCSGGGTELPGPSSPFQIYVMVDSRNAPSTKVTARQWRLWGVQSKDADSTVLESRGLLQADSTDVIVLPPDSGTYLVEAWTESTPPESLDVRVKMSNSDLPNPDSCMTSLSRSTLPTSVRGCKDGVLPSPSSASGFDAGHRPNVLTMVRVPGDPSHRFRILDSLGDTMSVKECRLWRYDRSLTFRGVMKLSGNAFPELPTILDQGTFLFEAWARPNQAPNRIPTTLGVNVLSVDQEKCTRSSIRPPLPETLTVYECQLPGGSFPRLSGGANPPNHWGFMEIESGD